MRSDYEVRVARLEDAAAVDRLLQASYPELMAPSYDEESLAPALKLMTKANSSLLVSGTYYVAELSTGLLVGCGGWTLGTTGGRNDRASHWTHTALRGESELDETWHRKCYLWSLRKRCSRSRSNGL